MAYEDLRDWIAALDRAGELKKIRTEVDPILEIAEITDRVSKDHARTDAAGGPALLFQNIKGHPDAQVLINQFGSARRMNLALGVGKLDEVADRIRQFMDVKSPQGFLDKIKMLPMLTEMGKILSENSFYRPLQRSHSARQFLTRRFPHSAVLAERCRPVYHSALCSHPRPQDRQTQRRNVQNAGL